jgi:hypothetical protein
LSSASERRVVQQLHDLLLTTMVEGRSVADHLRELDPDFFGSFGIRLRVNV